MLRPLFFVWSTLFLSQLHAQTISTVSTRWNDSFVEWDIYASEGQDEAESTDPPEEVLYGELKLRWLNVRDDFSEWTYELNGERGTIKQKWKNDPTQWELRTYTGDVVTMRASWSNDFSEWRLTNNSFSLTLGSRWKNRLDEWLTDDPNRGKFYIYTLREQDPRDWAVEDNLSEEVNEPMKMALIFLAIYHSTPKL
ncbi:MAG: hypothetical protein RL013_2335 [Bacteroidota bacterium]|jgi:hypothetical protein